MAVENTNGLEDLRLAEYRDADASPLPRLGPKGRSWQSLAVLAVVLVLSSAFAGFYLKRGWIPVDDGTLAQAALRITQGQLPHRDFVENYTGGLSFLNAVAFKLFGTNLLSMRIVALFFFLPWVAAVYYLALKFGSPLGAGLATLLAVSWSWPNYPTPMPSWYNLFFATFGAAALFRQLDTRKRRWFFVAGLFGGLSILIKIIGLYYVAGVLLYLVFSEQQIASSPGPGSRQSKLYKVFSISSLLCFIAVLLLVLRGHLNGGSVYQFVIPSGAVVALLISRERLVFSQVSSAERFKNLFAMLLPFLAGVLVPIIVFLVPYALSGSLGSVYQGVFAMGAERMEALAAVAKMPLGIIGAISAVAALLVLAVTSLGSENKLADVILSLLAIVLLLFSTKHTLSKLLIFYSAVMLYPVIITVGCTRIGRKSASEPKREYLLLLLCLAAVCGLVQFPVERPIYFCYFAPLVLLATWAIFSETRGHKPAIILGFYLVFAVALMTPSAVYRVDFNTGVPHEKIAAIRGGGIYIPSADAYRDLLRVVREHAGNSSILAFPEAPEIYFLAALKNPTRADGGPSPDELSAALRNGSIKLVVVNNKPFFLASKPDSKMMDMISEKFPESAEIGKYLVRWRK